MRVPFTPLASPFHARCALCLQVPIRTGYSFPLQEDSHFYLEMDSVTLLKVSRAADTQQLQDYFGHARWQRTRAAPPPGALRWSRHVAFFGFFFMGRRVGGLRVLLPCP